MGRPKRPKDYLIYVASTWKNDGPLLDEAHRLLRAAGFRTFDFRSAGQWWHNLPSESDPTKRWNQPARVSTFERDYKGLEAADAVLLVLPAGTDSHIEAAWASGRGKLVVVFGTPREGKYELMLRVVLKDYNVVLSPSATMADAVDVFEDMLLENNPPAQFCIADLDPEE